MQNILEWFIAGIIVVIWGYGLWQLVAFYRKIHKELTNTIYFVEENINKNPLLSVFPVLEQRLTQTSLPALAAAWREFDASLIKTSRTISTTVRAENYFNEQSLVDGPLQADLLRNIPGILTGLGIVGTFLGVITGLYGYNSQDLASVRNSISHLLHSVQGAFYISCGAVFGAILFTGIEKYLTSNLYVLVARFQQTLSRIFSHSVSDEYLQRMVEQLEEQGSALRSFSHDLAETIKVSLNELVENQNATLRENNLKFAETVKQALIEELSPTMRNLAEVMEKVRQTQSDAGQSVIQQMVADFQNALNGANNQQVQAITNALEGATGLLVGVQKEMSGLVASLREEGMQQQNYTSGQFEKISKQSMQQQQAMEDRLVSFMNQIQEHAHKWQEQLNQQQSQTIYDLKQGIGPLVSALNTTGQDMIAQTMNQQKVIEDRLTVFISQIQDNVQQWQQNLGQQQQQITTDIKNEINPLIQTMGASGQEMASKIEKAAELLEKERAYLEKSMSLCRDILDSHQQIFSDSRLTGQHWKDTAQIFQAVGSQLQGVNKKFDDSHLLLGKSVEAFQMHLQQAREQISAQRNAINDYQALSQQMKNDWATQRTSITELDKKVQEDLKTFAEITSKALRDYLTQVDANLDKIVQSMRGLVEPLQESVEELTEVLEQKNNAQQIRTGRY